MTRTKFINSGKLYDIVGHGKVINSLPVANYNVQYNELSNKYFLERVEPFTLPEKIYDSPEKLAEKYLKTFAKYNRNLGVLLQGMKGSGKTLLAKMICSMSNLPVVVVTGGYTGKTFFEFLEKVSEYQPVVVFFDEFEKMYPSEHDYVRADNPSCPQSQMLTLFDGVYNTKCLFLLTVNKPRALNDNYFNRPGRIHYRKSFEELSETMIDDIIADKLENTAHSSQLKTLARIGGFNMDCLTSVIREMNDFETSPEEAIKFMNVNLEANEYDIRGELQLRDQNGIAVYTNVRARINLLDFFECQLEFDESSSSSEILKPGHVDHTKNMYPYNLYLSNSIIESHMVKNTLTDGEFNITLDIPREFFRNRISRGGTLRLKSDNGSYEDYSDLVTGNKISDEDVNRLIDEAMAEKAGATPYATLKLKISPSGNSAFGGHLGVAFLTS